MNTLAELYPDEADRKVARDLITGSPLDTTSTSAYPPRSTSSSAQKSKDKYGHRVSVKYKDESVKY